MYISCIYHVYSILYILKFIKLYYRIYIYKPNKAYPVISDNG